MDKQPIFHPPQIEDCDANWACEVLDLPSHAFTGPDGKDPRFAILKDTTSLDVEACPGSGKTTLLVAKLAILAKKWTESRRGICILSHTNAARREIEKQLGNCAAGQALLSYPHFVGTIHAFVNEFLALPWLRSLGRSIRMIDDSHCEQHRRRLLAFGQFGALASYVKNKESSQSGGEVNIVGRWRLATPSFDVRKENGESEFKDQTGPAAKQLRGLAEVCALDGYYRYDEMFMWSHDLLECNPCVVDAIRFRFPMLFIDEVQDNNEDQSSLIHRVFMEGPTGVIRQRYGDSNQAIYLHGGEKGANTDLFPDKRIKREIPNSHRFGQDIADFADPLGLVPQNLKGCGPPQGLIDRKIEERHAIFLFGDATVQRVISAYAAHLCDTFSETELCNGEFTVVAARHHPAADIDKVPRFLGHYWPSYDPEITSLEAKPRTLYQYLTVGCALATKSGEARYVVENFAEGILRLVRISDPVADIGSHRRKHRRIVELLGANVETKNRYLSLVGTIAANCDAPRETEWVNEWLPVVVSVARAIGGTSFNTVRCSEFLNWQVSGMAESDTEQRDNIFRYPATVPKVRLRVGSIHSVKGETHTATLVLDSYFRRHHLATLKPWLLAERTGKANEGPENQSRLKQHYVAMTRPTHLLCLAMREDALTEADLAKLKRRNWQIARVRDDGYDWI